MELSYLRSRRFATVVIALLGGRKILLLKPEDCPQGSLSDSVVQLVVAQSEFPWRTKAEICRPFS